MSAHTISACITAFNESDNIRRCLESVKWCDEIVVVDSFSEDDTVAICREYTDRVYQHEWLGYIGQKNLIKGMATSRWILFVDADEAVSPALRWEIQQEFASGDCEEYAGYRFPRIVWYLQKWIRHGDWYPDYKLRLFQRSRGGCQGVEPHDEVVVDGLVKSLRGPLYHYTYSGIADQVLTLNNFSSITAREWHRKGRRFRAHDLLLRPLYRFIKCYFIKRGCLDGLRGLVIAITVAYGTFIKYAKLWEADLSADAVGDDERHDAINRDWDAGDGHAPQATHANEGEKP